MPAEGRDGLDTRIPKTRPTMEGCGCVRISACGRSLALCYSPAGVHRCPAPSMPAHRRRIGTLYHSEFPVSLRQRTRCETVTHRRTSDSNASSCSRRSSIIIVDWATLRLGRFFSRRRDWLRLFSSENAVHPLRVLHQRRPRGYCIGREALMRG